MRMLDLFSGIGGFSLAASWVWGNELEIVGFCEIEEYCQKVLAKNFPGVSIYSDIRELKGEQFNNIDLITGGFPCQDISAANQNGKGIEGERSGLWKEMHRLIGEIRPGYCLLENVAALFHRGLSVVLADLAEIGYDAEWQSISAAQLGAPHERERIWIVAYPHSFNGEGWQSGRSSGTVQKRRVSGQTKEEGDVVRGPAARRGGFCGREPWQVEPSVGRMVNGLPRRVDRIKGLGNAIVPQCAALVMEHIKPLIKP